MFPWIKNLILMKKKTSEFKRSAWVIFFALFPFKGVITRLLDAWARLLLATKPRASGKHSQRQRREHGVDPIRNLRKRGITANAISHRPISFSHCTPAELLINCKVSSFRNACPTLTNLTICCFQKGNYSCRLIITFKNENDFILWLKPYLVANFIPRWKYSVRIQKWYNWPNMGKTCVLSVFLPNYLLPLFSTTHKKDFKWLIKRTKKQ